VHQGIRHPLQRLRTRTAGEVHKARNTAHNRGKANQLG
jgi:hypothetical protein